MKSIAVLAALLLGAHTAAAQCTGDFNGDLNVSIDELITSVNNSLSSCQQQGCPIDFADENTAIGTPDCLYFGRWSPTCGADDLEARWISDLAADETEEDIVIVDFLGFDPPLFYGAATTSPSSGDLIGFFRELDASDLVDAPGTLTLTEGGRGLIVDSDGMPFPIDDCQFERYEGALTFVRYQAIVDGTALPALRRSSANLRVKPAAIERLRAARANTAKP